MAYSKYNDLRFRPDSPVKEGEEYDVEIISVGEKGDGIAKVQGFVVVVPGAKKGDNVKVKVTAVRGRVSFAEVVGEGQAAPAEEEASGEETSTDQESEESKESDEAEKTEEKEEEKEESSEEAAEDESKDEEKEEKEEENKEEETK